MLPIAKFRNQPPATRLRKGSSEQRWTNQQQDSTDESRKAIEGWNEYFAGFQEQEINTPEGKFTVLVKSASDGTTAGGAPWQMTKQPNRILRVWPSAIWDGKGNNVWPSYNGIASSAETFVDVELPARPDHGYVWLECQVSDDDDEHGIIQSASIKAGAKPESGFLQRTGSTVNIHLAEYFLTGNTFTLDALRSFVFVLRRYGPPQSFTWDCEPL
jgi:hypothetical protein